MTAPQFDYVIVGGGSAGATLANRLSADARVTVCLLEAGGDGRVGADIVAVLLDPAAGSTRGSDDLSTLGHSVHEGPLKRLVVGVVRAHDQVAVSVRIRAEVGLTRVQGEVAEPPDGAQLDGVLLDAQTLTVLEQAAVLADHALSKDHRLVAGIAGEPGAGLGQRLAGGVGSAAELPVRAAVRAGRAALTHPRRRAQGGRAIVAADRGAGVRVVVAAEQDAAIDAGHQAADPAVPAVLIRLALAHIDHAHVPAVGLGPLRHVVGALPASGRAVVTGAEESRNREQRREHDSSRLPTTAQDKPDQERGEAEQRERARRASTTRQDAATVPAAPSGGGRVRSLLVGRPPDEWGRRGHEHGLGGVAGLIDCAHLDPLGRVGVYLEDRRAVLVCESDAARAERLEVAVTDSNREHQLVK